MVVDSSSSFLAGPLPANLNFSPSSLRSIDILAECCSCYSQRLFRERGRDKECFRCSYYQYFSSDLQRPAESASVTATAALAQGENHHPKPPTQQFTTDMPIPIFQSCGHPFLPLPAHQPYTATPNSIPGYCRPCHFTSTRKTVDRITEQSNERIKELDACIERAKVQLWREWTDELGERKEMAIVQVVKLRRERVEECERVWREFDERWGGRPLAPMS